MDNGTNKIHLQEGDTMSGTIEAGLSKNYNVYGIVVKEDVDPRLITITQDDDTIVLSKRVIAELIKALQEVQQ